MVLLNVFSNTTDLLPKLQFFLKDHFTDKIVDITYDDRFYNGMVILCFDGTTSMYEKKIVMQKAYVYESGAKRVHHVIAIHLNADGFDKTNVLWRSSAGDQDVRMHRNIETVLCELIQTHITVPTIPTTEKTFLW